MPDTLAELPGVVTQPCLNPRYAGLKPFRDSQSARQGAARSHEARRRRAQEQAALRANLTQKDTQDEPDYVLELIQEEIIATRAALKAKLEPHHRAALLRALCDLLDRRRIARGEPLPGSLRPTPDRERRQARSTGPAYLPPTGSVPPTT